MLPVLVCLVFFFKSAGGGCCRSPFFECTDPSPSQPFSVPPDAADCFLAPLSSPAGYVLVGASVLVRDRPIPVLLQALFCYPDFLFFSPSHLF